jgi:hypothetical protein
MSQETTDNFWSVWNAWTPPAPLELTYRLYYDDQGCPLFYSMEQLPGNYIELDRETWTQSPTNIRIKNGKLEYIEKYQALKLVPVSRNGTACHPRDVCIVVDQQQSHTKWGFKSNDAS